MPLMVRYHPVLNQKENTLARLLSISHAGIHKNWLAHNFYFCVNLVSLTIGRFVRSIRFVAGSTIVSLIFTIPEIPNLPRDTLRRCGNEKLASWSFWQNTCRPIPRIPRNEGLIRRLCTGFKLMFHMKVPELLCRF